MSAAFLVAWLVQGVVIAALFTCAAALLQWIARETVPARAIWGAALLGTTLLTFASPFRLVQPSKIPDGVVIVAGVPVAADQSGAAAFDLGLAVDRATARIRALLDAPVAAASEAMRARSTAYSTAGLILWTLVAGGLVLGLAVSHRKLRRLLRAAEPRVIADVPVRLTADLGPAVVGVRAPVVAVPRWLLGLPSAEQALVVRHEQAHVLARDPLLLTTGVALAALQPWNPFAWLMLSRLRLAIELDCDRRLLRSGTSPRAYGDLLIALAAAASPATRPAALHPMFSIHRSHLAQRIIAMTERPVRLISTRRVAAALLASAVAVAACESRLPTDAEVASMDAAMVEKAVLGTPIIEADQVKFYVNGQQVSGDVARAIAASDVQTVEVRKGAESEIRILTKKPGVVAEVARDRSARPSRTGGDGEQEVRVVSGQPFEVRADSIELLAPSLELRAKQPADGSVRVMRLDGERETRVVPQGIRDGRLVVRREPSAQDFSKGFTGVLMVDGVRVSNSVFDSIRPDQIESVTVIKAALGQQLYGPDAANGVIQIVTKKR